MKNIFLQLFILSCFVSNCRSENNLQTANKNIPGEDVSNAALLGQGLNSVDGTVKGHCVTLGDIGTESGEKTGSVAEYRFLEITSEQSLRENLNVSAAISIKGGLYGGSGRFNFISSVNKNSSSKYVLVHAKVANQLEIAKSFKFTDEAKNLLRGSRTKEFLTQCGNEFVYGRRTGGEFYALFEYEFSSSEEEKKFSAVLKASGMAWKAATNINDEMSKFNMSARVHVKMFRLGGSGPMPEITNLEDYGRKFSEIVSSISGNAVTLELITKDYSGVSPIDLVPNLSLLERQKFVINSIAKNRDEANETIATLRYVKMNLEKFEPINLGVLDKGDSELVSYINKQNDAAVTCFENIWSGCLIPQIAFPSVQVPQRKWDNSNMCPLYYSWNEQKSSCCKMLAKVSCELPDGNGGCLGYQTKWEQVCL